MGLLYSRDGTEPVIMASGQNFASKPKAMDRMEQHFGQEAPSTSLPPARSIPANMSDVKVELG
ncbi:MAG: hypothetical protein CVU65_08050 [Deltaproteobacteria bacterium HGW-Deltaproteobacteria-22]|jgi:hypothetical protein|nr:MAG: hypothetical protein CVU65_08050 [Deltaproteobacteria bacterium HGW-Deltaproteobacteria-22]